MEAKAGAPTQAQTAPGAVPSDAQTLTAPKGPSPAASAVPPVLQLSVIRPAAADGKARIYIFRPSVFTNYTLASSFYVDDAKISDLRPNDCAVIAIRPGAHILKQRWKPIPILSLGGPQFRPDKAISIPLYLQPNGSYYYIFYINPIEASGLMWHQSWGVREEGAAAGKEWMGGCHYTAAASADLVPTEYRSRNLTSPVSDKLSTSGAASAP